MMTTKPLAPGCRVLALDFGQKRMGIAVSDSLLMIAHGRDTLQYRSQRELFERLQALIREERVGLIVVGMPHRMDGSEGEMSRTVRSFITELQERTSLPVVAWDERLSSRQAERALIEMGTSRRRKRGAVDKLAAIFILQSYLDSVTFKSDKRV